MLIMGVFTLYFLIPIWWLLVSSTKSVAQFTTTAPLGFTPDAIPNFVANVGRLFAYNDGVFPNWILNSVLYAGAGAFLGTVVAAMCGYALAKYRFRGREAVFNVVLGGVLVPATALALPLFLIFSQIQLTNTFWAVFLPSIVSPVRRLSRADLRIVERSGRTARSGSPRRLRRGPHLLHRRGPADGAGARDDLPLPVRRDLEQLLPAAHHAAGPDPVPGDPRSLRLEQRDRPEPRAARRSSSSARSSRSFR